MTLLEKVLLVITTALTSHTVYSQVTRPGNTITPFATGISSPVSIANCGDSRLFVVSQPGYIYIVDPGGNVDPVPFLDIHDRVTYGGERGLLGLAFHPQYFSNGYFYVDYVGAGDSTHISRFSVSSSDPDQADPGSEVKIMTIYQPYQNHNGGNVAFGPDGYLYIGMGDGGAGGDPENRAQNPLSYLGKMLRIDVDQGATYGVPISNPFYNALDTLGEIWALGLRNPWRFSFDRTTGDLWIADVGQNAWEEIDYQPAGSQGGENYGWRCYEGNQPYNMSGCETGPGYTFPVWVYPHGPECSVTGGFVYRGNTTSPFYGYYFFADYCSDRIWTLHNEAGNWKKEDFGQFPGNGFSTFGEDSQGQLYVAGLATGTIYLVNDNATGISEEEAPSVVIIYQAPFSSTIMIEINKADTSLVRINLFDLDGRSFLSDSFRGRSYQLDEDSLPTGIYLLQLEFNGKTIVRKLVIK